MTRNFPPRSLRRLAPILLIAVVSSAAEPNRQTEVEAIVREYLLEHPDVVVQALQKFHTMQKAESEKAALEAVGSRRAELRGDADSPAFGDPKDPATIVEFFDYRCGYCRQTSSSVVGLANGRKARVIFKELPILGPESVTLARAALAAHRQGLEHYLKFHEAAMATHEPVTTDLVSRLAAKAGLDAARLQSDMNSPEIQKAIDRNMALAEALGVRATPTFVIGEEKVEGAIDGATLSRKLAKLKSDGQPRVAATR